MVVLAIVVLFVLTVMVMLGCQWKPGHYLELLWLIQLLTVVSGVTAPSSKVCKIK